MYDAITTFLDDLRCGIRMLTRQPAGVVVMVLMLALGIGANVAIFSLVYGVLLRPLDYQSPERLVEVIQTHEQLGQVTATTAAFLEWRSSSRELFEYLAAMQRAEVDLVGQGEPERLEAARVSRGFFELLGVTPAIGRTFGEAEESPGEQPVVVLGNRTWQSRFGADRGLEGKAITLDGVSHTVVGVLPPGFRGPEAFGADVTEAWLPLAVDSQGGEGQHVRVLGRLRPGVTLEQARTAMDVLGARTGPRIPGDTNRTGAAVISLHEQTVREIRPRLLLLLGAVSFILLIAAANVANLLLAKGLARRRELAVKTALGASRGRIARQLLTESGLLALAGGVLGVVLAHWTVHGLVHLLAHDLPRAAEVRVDPVVLGFAFAVALLTGFACGLAPAILGSRIQAGDTLRVGHGRAAADPGFVGRRLRRGLVVCELSLTLMLVNGAGLLANSFVRLTRVDPGFRLDHRVALGVSLTDDDPRDDRERALLFEGILDRLRATPGVEEMGAVGSLPLSGNRTSTTVRPADQPPPASPLQLPMATVEPVSPAYFATMGIPLATGRFFFSQDREGSPPVVIVNQATAAELWPGQDPIGKQLAQGSSSKRPPLTVVGVVGAVRDFSPGHEPELQMYVPFQQQPPRGMDIVVRSRLDPTALAPGLKRAVWEVSAHQPVTRLRTLTEVYWSSLSRTRLLTLVLTVFAALGLGLSATGVYSLMSYTVNQRTPELGIRLALGADPRQVVGLALKGGMTLIVTGLLLGAILALGASRLLASQLFGIQPTDPATFVAVTLLLAVVAGIACLGPVRRAAKVDPAASLRAE